MEFRAVLNRPKTCDHEIHISQTSRWVLYTAGICTTGRFVFRSKLVYDPERNPIQRMPYSFLRVHVYFPSLRTRSNTPVISCTQIRCVYSAHNPMACVCVLYIRWMWVLLTHDYLIETTVEIIWLAKTRRRECNNCSIWI